MLRMFLKAAARRGVDFRAEARGQAPVVMLALIELGSATRPLAFQDHPFSIRAVALSPLAGRLASMEAADERIPDTADAAGALRAGRAPEMEVGAVRGHAGFQL